MNGIRAIFFSDDLMLKRGGDAHFVPLQFLCRLVADSVHPFLAAYPVSQASTHHPPLSSSDTSQTITPSHSIFAQEFSPSFSHAPTTRPNDPWNQSHASQPHRHFTSNYEPLSKSGVSPPVTSSTYNLSSLSESLTTSSNQFIVPWQSSNSTAPSIVHCLFASKRLE